MSTSSRSGLERLWPVYGIEPGSDLIDFSTIKPINGESVPSQVLLEVGFGMGHATAQLAQADPSTLIIAVDVHAAGISSLMRMCERDEITNVRVIQGDAVKIINEMIAVASLTGFRLFFPDPWPKARHQKRRFVQPELVRLVTSRLMPGAMFHCATDWRDYAVQMLQVLEDEPELTNKYEGYAPRPDWRPMTSFEKRGIAKGHTIFDLIFEKNTEPIYG